MTYTANRLVVGGAVLVAVIAWIVLFFGASTGYGYAGHGGYHRGPSFFYFGGVSTYHDPSVRTGSRSGPGVRGGGLHGGK